MNAIAKITVSLYDSATGTWRSAEEPVYFATPQIVSQAAALALKRIVRMLALNAIDPDRDRDVHQRQFSES